MAIDIEEYYNRYGAMVLRRCRYLLKNEDMAMDAMQDTFVNLLKIRERKIDYPSSFLYKIATNVCLNSIRQNKNADSADDSILFQIASSERIEENFIAAEIIDNIFLREKSSTRLIAVMRYVDGMSLEDISDETGLSVSGVRKRLRNLRINAGEHFGERNE